MAHPRKLIRQAVVALLASGPTAAGTRVKATRVEPNRSTQLPALAVYTLTEAVEKSQSAPVEITRELQLEITGWVAPGDAMAIDDAMDDIAEQIEIVMDANPYLSNTAVDVVLAGTSMQVVEDNGRTDPLVGIVTLTYAVTYRTVPLEPTGLDDFEKVGATTKVAGVADTVPASDTFTVEAP